MSERKADPVGAIHQFFERLSGARACGLSLSKALQVAGTKDVVVRDGVLVLPDDWWWCAELKVWLPPDFGPADL